jgi:hypothetical protein
MNTSSLTDSMMALNLLNFSAASERSLTTMNVKHLSIYSTVESIPELITQLVCQQNTWGDHYNSLWRGGSEQTTLSVLDHNESLATTCGDNDLTKGIVLKSSKCSLLVRTKGEHECLADYPIIIAENRPCGAV